MRLSEILELTDIDIAKMDEQELRKVIRSEQRIIRARKREFEQANIKDTPALSGLKSSGGAITTRGKTFNQLRSELYRGKRFLSAKTSTVSGFRNVQSATADRLGGELSETGWKRMWKAYAKIKEDPETSGYFNALGSTRVQQMLHDEISQDRRASRQKIIDRVEQKLKQEYERGIDTDDFWESISDSFDVGENPFE